MPRLSVLAPTLPPSERPFFPFSELGLGTFQRGPGGMGPSNPLTLNISAPGALYYPEWNPGGVIQNISIDAAIIVLRGFLLPVQLLRIMEILPLLLVMVRRPLLLLHAGLHVSVAEVLGRLRRHLRQRLLLLGRGRRSVLGRRGRRRVLAELGPHGTAPDGMNLARHAERSVARRASAADSTGRWRLHE